MKHLLTTIGLLTVLAVVVGFASFRASGNAAVQTALAKQDAMEWLRADFDLTEAQFAKIKKLHDAYSLVCAEHCREIQMATRSRNELRVAEGADAASLAAADRRVEELRLICESAIATHVRQCADLMSLSARERYLALVLPKIKDFDHTAAPDLLINHGRH